MLKTVLNRAIVFFILDFHNELILHFYNELLKSSRLNQEVNDQNNET